MSDYCAYCGKKKCPICKGNGVTVQKTRGTVDIETTLVCSNCRGRGYLERGETAWQRQLSDYFYKYYFGITGD